VNCARCQTQIAPWGQPANGKPYGAISLVDGKRVCRPCESAEARQRMERFFAGDDTHTGSGNPLDTICRGCQSNDGPSHAGSEQCQSGSIASGGTRAHCTCDVCY